MFFLLTNLLCEERDRMEQQFARTQILLGREAMERLAHARVAVFGIGGVGGHVCEALARSGVGALDLIDHDKVCLTNLNRQIIATHRTIGRYKADVMRERILEINPEAAVRVYRCFFLPENAEQFPFAAYDYVVDAVDTVTAKIELILRAKEHRVPVISSMGAGNKLDASAFRAADLYETKVCPLAKVMRRELRKRNVEHLKVVYSEEMPLAPCWEDEQILQERSVQTPLQENRPESLPQDEEPGAVGRRAVPGSTAFVPAVAGLILAGEVVKDLAASDREKKEDASVGLCTEKRWQ